MSYFHITWGDTFPTVLEYVALIMCCLVWSGFNLYINGVSLITLLVFHSALFLRCIYVDTCYYIVDSFSLLLKHTSTKRLHLIFWLLQIMLLLHYCVFPTAYIEGFLKGMYLKIELGNV